MNKSEIYSNISLYINNIRQSLNVLQKAMDEDMPATVQLFADEVEFDAENISSLASLLDTDDEEDEDD